MFTTNYLLLMPVIGVAAGLAAAMLVVRRQDARLASVGFGVKGAEQLAPLYIKEGGMVTLSVLLALIIFGSSALMLKEYLNPPRPVLKRVIVLGDNWNLGPGGSVKDIPDMPTRPAGSVGATPTGGIPIPVIDTEASTEDIGTQDDWATQAKAGAIDLDKLNRDSVEIVRNDEPDKGYVALERYPELVKKVDPVYPAIAVTMGREGRVMVQMLQDLDGSVMRAEVAKSSGDPSLDEAALTAVRQWRFTPAIAPGGKPTRVWQTYPISFTLSR